MDTAAEVSPPRAPVGAVVPLPAAQRALLEWNPHSQLVLDADLRIRYVNQAALAFAVLEQDALIGRSLWEGFPTYTASIVHEACDRCRATGAAAHTERYDHERDQWLSATVFPAADDLVAILSDITEQLRGEKERARVDAQLQQAQKLESLGVLAGGIAHDFNNLLVGILGNASLAMLDLEPGALARESISQIEQAGQRAAELTRQLLAYAGKGRYVVEPTDATAVISDMTSLLRTAISRNASLQLDLTTSLPTIDVDVNQFRQVLMNLVTNASDALDGNPGLIRISTGRQEVSREYLAACAPGGDARLGTHTFVEVHDSGTGMDAITRQRMFEPFFSTKFTGRGLGLAATMGIMRSHHGAVRVESELGSGTTVRLLFPSSVSSGGEGLATGLESEAWHGDGQILVVDDEAGVRAVASALLRRRGFRTQEASDGAMAMDIFRAQPDAFNLVLLDLTMPTMGGEATLQALREVKPSVRVVLMSGHNETDVTRLFAGRNLSGYLQKPFRAEELYASIARCLPV
jgi:two-component system cell cycle sensor histidine kinase/response regulator CckA